MAFFRALLVLWLATTLVSAAEPSRMIPSGGLEAYLEFDGLDAHLAAWNSTAARAILEDTPAGAMIADLIGQVADHRLRKIPAVKLRGEDIEALTRHIARLGFVVAAHRHGESRASITVILPGAGRKENRERFDRLLRPLVESKHVSTSRVRGREQFQIIGKPPENPAGPADPRLAWWFEADVLVILVNPPQAHVAAVLDAIDGKAANATTHPGRLASIAEGKTIPGFEPVGLFFIERGKDGVFRNFIKDALESTFAGPNLAADRLDDRLKDLTKAADSFRIPEAPGIFDLPSPPVRAPITPPSPMIRPAPPPPAGDDKPGEPLRVPFPGLPPTPLRLDPPPALPSSARVDGLDVPSKPENKSEDPAKILGLDGVTRIVGRHGFHGKALLSVVRIEAPAPRKGVLACLDARPFRKDSLPPFLRGTTSLAVVGIDPAGSYDKAVALLKRLNPESAEIVAQVETKLKEATGLLSRRELLEHIGSTWFLLTIPDPKRDNHSQPVIVAMVRDREAFVKALDTIADRINTTFRDREARADDSNRRKEKDLPLLSLERLPAPEQGYRLTSPAGLVLWFGEGAFEPTILVGKKYLAMAAHPKEARAALSAESDLTPLWTPSDEALSALAILPDNPILLTYHDSLNSPWPGLFAEMPSMVQTISNFFEDFNRSETATGPDLLSLLGLPEPGGFRVRIAPSKVPAAERIKAHLFPSMMAVSLDDRGLRMIVREALPTGLTPMVDVGIRSTFEWSGKGFKRDLKMRAEISLPK